MEGNKNEPEKNQVFLDQPNEHCTGLRGFALEPVECASHTPLGQGQIWVRPWRCTEIQTFRIFDKKSLTGFSDHVFTHPILLLLPQINPLLSHPELPPEVLDILDATLCSNGEQLGGEDLPHARHSGLLNSETMKFCLIGNKSNICKVGILNNNGTKQELYIDCLSGVSRIFSVQIFQFCLKVN